MLTTSILIGHPLHLPLPSPLFRSFFSFFVSRKDRYRTNSSLIATFRHGSLLLRGKLGEVIGGGSEIRDKSTLDNALILFKFISGMRLKYCMHTHLNSDIILILKLTWSNFIWLNSYFMALKTWKNVWNFDELCRVYETLKITPQISSFPRAKLAFLKSAKCSNE